MHYRFRVGALALLAVAVACAAGCGKEKTEGAPQGESSQRYTDTTIQHFTFHGTPVTIDTAALSVTLDHEKIEGYMDAMVMPFKVESPALLQRMTVGTRMLFTLRVANNTAVITDVRGIDSASQGK